MHFSPSQHDELSGLLERRAEELHQAVDRARNDIAAPGGGASGWAEVRDSGEEGDARMMATLDLSQLQRLEVELSQVLAARQRMREGVYGVCEDCDQPIPFERLKILPETRYCVRDEERRERERPGPGGGR
jgi:DnaK suppressor protein